MPGLSPYSAAFIGNNLKSGNLSLALDYSLKDRKLKGKNNIVAKNLYLGEEVPSETAVEAPVGLGLALLRDLGGVIDLDVGVSGDLDDPGFSVGGIIAKALLNIIVKAAASPFKLLGALVGSDENLGEIEFARGVAGLTPANEARLKQLSEALAQRPNLAVSVQGNASQAEDGEAINARKVLQQAAAARGMAPETLRAEAGDADWWETPENRDALSSLNDALGLPPVAERRQQLQEKTPELLEEALSTEVFRQAYLDIVAAQDTDAAELLALADGRALAVKQYLVDALGLDHQRVSVTKARKSDFTGRTLALEIETM
jgi:outer membrane protein OmpA-like peptidoglycan-associated protein